MPIRLPGFRSSGLWTGRPGPWLTSSGFKHWVRKKSICGVALQLRRCSVPLVRFTPQFSRALHLELFTNPLFGRLFTKLSQFRVLKNGLTASVGARGPERNAPEASVGRPIGHEDQSLFPTEEAGVFSPPHPRRNMRLIIPSGPVWPPGPGTTWPLRHSFYQSTEVLPCFYLFTHTDTYLSLEA